MDLFAKVLIITLSLYVFTGFFQVQVNGKNEDPIFTFLKSRLPAPHDDQVIIVVLIDFLLKNYFQENLIDDPKYIMWRPVKRSDISWNFEKFLVGPDGKPVKRYSKSFLTSDIEKDIEELIEKSK